MSEEPILYPNSQLSSGPHAKRFWRIRKTFEAVNIPGGKLDDVVCGPNGLFLIGVLHQAKLKTFIMHPHEVDNAGTAQLLHLIRGRLEVLGVLSLR